MQDGNHNELPGGNASIVSDEINVDEDKSIVGNSKNEISGSGYQYQHENAVPINIKTLQPHHQMQQQMNLVAQYEAQMREHAAAFAQAAAGASQVLQQAAQIAYGASGGGGSPFVSNNAVNPGCFMSGSGGYNTNPSMPMTVPQHSFSPFYPSVAHHGNPAPMLNAESPFYYPHMTPPSATVYYNSNHEQHEQYQFQQQSHRQRNRDRTEQSLPNHPNKRHHKMQNSNDDISLKMEQMQFQPHPHQFSENNGISSASHHVNETKNNDNNYSKTNASTKNKRPHSSSSYLPVMPSQPQQFFSNGTTNPPYSWPNPSNHISFRDDSNSNNTKRDKKSRSTRRLWTPGSSENRNRNQTTSHHQKSSHFPQQQHKTFDETSTTNNSNNRSRRRLHSSLDSGGNSSGTYCCSNNKKKSFKKCAPNNNKKRMSSSQNSKDNLKSNNDSGQSRLISLMGKTGAMALHELCSKLHWDAPKFVEVKQGETQLNISNTNTSSASENSNNQKILPFTLPTNSFYMSVHVQGKELGKGRGGTKAAARQDASRQALCALLPHSIFDPNGILIQIGPPYHRDNHQQKKGDDKDLSKSTECASIISKPSTSAMNTPAATAGCVDDIHHLHSLIDTYCCIINPETANTQHAMTAKPEPSATLTKSPHIYPCASSGISSASEDDDSYYASRGASVCSTLLHAMWQISYKKIQEPPKYVFEVCTAEHLLLASSSNNNDKAMSPSSTEQASGSVTTKTTPIFNAHRSSFACIASIMIEDSVEIKKVNDLKESNGIAEKESEAVIHSKSKSLTISDNNENQDDSNQGGEKIIIHQNETHHRKNESTHRSLVATGTGATKREAKHAASAKLLALLFPQCNGLVEVMAAAESARETYAASKALSKHNKQRGGSSPHQCEKIKKVDDPVTSNNKENLTKTEYSNQLDNIDPPLDSETQNRLRLLTSNRIQELKETGSSSFNSNDNLLRVAKLSISEPDNTVCNSHPSSPAPASHYTKTTDNKFCLEESLKRQLVRQKQLESEVDRALQKLSEFDEEGRPSLGVASYTDDIGRVVLRRATHEDINQVRELFSSFSQSKNESNTSHTSNTNNTKLSELQEQNLSINQTSLAPISLLEFCSSSSSQLATSSSISCLKEKRTNEYGNATASTMSATTADDSNNLPLLMWGGVSFALILSRAIAGCCEPPLGCAVLTTKFELLGSNIGARRVLKVCEMAHAEHIPVERFTESLEAFASYMGCQLQILEEEEDVERNDLEGDCTLTELSMAEMEKLIHESTSNVEKDDKICNTLMVSSYRRRIGTKQKARKFLSNKFSSTPILQAVQEEAEKYNEELEEDSSSPQQKKKDGDKVLLDTTDHTSVPCKRSRVS